MYEGFMTGVVHDVKQYAKTCHQKSSKIQMSKEQEPISCSVYEFAEKR